MFLRGRVEALEERLGFVSENLARLIDLEPRIQRRADEVQQQFRSSDLAARMADGEQQQHTWATELEQRVDDRIAGIELAIARKLNIDVRDQR